jgi:hypothetical protein
MTPSPKNRECRICLEYISFDAESAGDARSTLCFWLLGSSQPKNWGEEGRNVPNVRTNPLCQIRLTHISFDAPSDGDARGALRFCCWGVFSRKTGVTPHRGCNVPNVRIVTIEGGNFPKF